MNVIYAATGCLYIKEAIKSAKSLRQFHPNCHITLYADAKPKNSQIFDEIKKIPEKVHALLAKIYAIRDSKYDNLLFLDTDTKITASLSEPWKLLEAYEFLICNEPFNVDKILKSDWPKYKNMTHYNTGVFWLRKTPLTRALLDEWYQECASGMGEEVKVGQPFGDQQCFNRIYFQRGQYKEFLKLHVLDNLLYNARGGMFHEMKRDGIFHQARILHCHSVHHTFGRRLRDKIVCELRSFCSRKR